MSAANSSVKRVSPPGIIPLELWDMETEHGVLWTVMLRPDFGAILHTCLQAMLQGQARSRSDGPLPERLRDIDCVMICGGRADGLRNAFDWSKAVLPVLFDDTGCYVGEAAGLALAEGKSPVMTIDLGQSAVKIMVAGKRHRFERDILLLPIAPAASEHATQRRHLRAFLSHAIEASCRLHDLAVPDNFVLALPCEISPDGTPGGSSYGGMLGDSGLVSDVLRSVCDKPFQALVLNDAELAAYSIKLANRALPGKTALVLTIGFSVGAALLVID